MRFLFSWLQVIILSLKGKIQGTGRFLSHTAQGLIHEPTRLSTSKDLADPKGVYYHQRFRRGSEDVGMCLLKVMGLWPGFLQTSKRGGERGIADWSHLERPRLISSIPLAVAVMPPGASPILLLIHGSVRQERDISYKELRGASSWANTR